MGPIEEKALSCVERQAHDAPAPETGVAHTEIAESLKVCAITERDRAENLRLGKLLEQRLEAEVINGRFGWTLISANQAHEGSASRTASRLEGITPITREELRSSVDQLLSQANQRSAFQRLIDLWQESRPLNPPSASPQLEKVYEQLLSVLAAGRVDDIVYSMQRVARETEAYSLRAELARPDLTGNRLEEIPKLFEWFGAALGDNRGLLESRVVCAKLAADKHFEALSGLTPGRSTAERLISAEYLLKRLPLSCQKEGWSVERIAQDVVMQPHRSTHLTFFLHGDIPDASTTNRQGKTGGWAQDFSISDHRCQIIMLSLGWSDVHIGLEHEHDHVMTRLARPSDFNPLTASLEQHVINEVCAFLTENRQDLHALLKESIKEFYFPTYDEGIRAHVLDDDGRPIGAIKTSEIAERALSFIDKVRELEYGQAQLSRKELRQMLRTCQSFDDFDRSLPLDGLIFY